MQLEVDAFMENCAKRWQTKEGTYQLKRRRLKPDKRDPPENDLSADVDLWFHLVSLSFANFPDRIPLPGAFGLCVGFVCLCLFVWCCWLLAFREI